MLYRNTAAYSMKVASKITFGSAGADILKIFRPQETISRFLLGLGSLHKFDHEYSPSLEMQE